MEKLVQCLDDRVIESTKNAASISDNHYVKGLMSSQDLIACKDNYHVTCYKLFTKPKTCTAKADLSKEVELMAFKEMIKECNDVCYKPKLLSFLNLLKNMENITQSKNVIAGIKTKVSATTFRKTV